MKPQLGEVITLMLGSHTGAGMGVRHLLLLPAPGRMRLWPMVTDHTTANV